MGFGEDAEVIGFFLIEGIDTCDWLQPIDTIIIS